MSKTANYNFVKQTNSTASSTNINATSIQVNGQSLQKEIQDILASESAQDALLANFVNVNNATNHIYGLTTIEQLKVSTGILTANYNSIFFGVVPTMDASLGITGDTQIVNKLYVDTAINSTALLSSDNTFSGYNTFSGSNIFGASGAQSEVFYGVGYFNGGLLVANTFTATPAYCKFTCQPYVNLASNTTSASSLYALTSRDYVDKGDATTLTSAKAYSDTGEITTLTSAKAYSDTMLTSANVYSDTTLTSANVYSDTTLTSAKAYCDLNAGSAFVSQKQDTFIFNQQAYTTLTNISSSGLVSFSSSANAANFLYAMSII